MRLEALRKAKAMTRRELAIATGITETSIYRYERMNRIPDLDVGVKMAEALGCDAKELLDVAPDKQESRKATPST